MKRKLSPEQKEAARAYQREYHRARRAKLTEEKKEAARAKSRERQKDPKVKAMRKASQQRYIDSLSPEVKAERKERQRQYNASPKAKLAIARWKAAHKMTPAQKALKAEKERLKRRRKPPTEEQRERARLREKLRSQLKKLKKGPEPVSGLVPSRQPLGAAGARIGTVRVDLEWDTRQWKKSGIAICLVPLYYSIVLVKEVRAVLIRDMPFAVVHLSKGTAGSYVLKLRKNRRCAVAWPEFVTIDLADASNNRNVMMGAMQRAEWNIREVGRRSGIREIRVRRILLRHSVPRGEEMTKLQELFATVGCLLSPGDFYPEKESKVSLDLTDCLTYPADRVPVEDPVLTHHQKASAWLSLRRVIERLKGWRVKSVFLLLMDGYSEADIARIEGVSRERARQIIELNLKKVRRAVRTLDCADVLYKMFGGSGDYSDCNLNY